MDDDKDLPNQPDADGPGAKVTVAHAEPAQAARRGPGRPKGSKNKKRERGLLETEQLVRDEGRRVIASHGMTAGQLALRLALKSAGDGKVTAQAKYIDRLMKIEEKQRAAEQKELERADLYIREAELLLDGVVGEEEKAFLVRHLVPHPDDVEIDWVKREVRIHGPASPREKREWDAFKIELKKAQGAALVWRDFLSIKSEGLDDQEFYLKIVEKLTSIAMIFSERHRPPPLINWEGFERIRCEMKPIFAEIDGLDWPDLAEWFKKRKALAKKRARSAKTGEN